MTQPPRPIPPAPFTSQDVAIFSSGVHDLELALDAIAQTRLIDYLALLDKWNRVYNLTAVRTPRDMVVRHLLDSLAIAPYLVGTRVLDVGTGPGLPGIPLAVACPERRFVLLDSKLKKVRFVVQAAAQLVLNHVEVIQSRVEDYHPEEPFDTVVSRAYATLRDMAVSAGHLCRPGGRLLAMKGRYPEGELAELPSGYMVDVVYALQVPGLAEERHAVCLRKLSDSGTSPV